MVNGKKLKVEGGNKKSKSNSNFFSDFSIPTSDLRLLPSAIWVNHIKLGKFFNIWLPVTLSLVVFSGFFAKPAAAGSIAKIDESVLDAKMGDKKNRLAVVFMAGWCAPCIDELPTLNKLHKKFKNQGLEIIGISIDLDGPDAMQPVVSALKIDFPVYWYGEKAVEKFALFAIPMLFLVKEGEIVERIHGRRTDSFLDEKFRNLLN